MDEFVKAHNKIIFETTIQSLKKNGFSAEFFATKEEAANFIMNQAADCNSVGIAGTHTIRALGVVPLLEKAGKTLFDHWKLKFGYTGRASMPQRPDARRFVPGFCQRAYHDR